MNVSRRLPDNTVNEKEVNQQTIAMTSAGIKNSFAYDTLIDMFANAMNTIHYEILCHLKARLARVYTR